MYSKKDLVNWRFFSLNFEIKNLLKKTPGGHGFHFSKKSIFEFTESKRLKILETNIIKD